MIRFNCDYLEGCHPKILEKLIATNMEQNPGYGMDPHCMHAAELIREAFDCPDSAVHFLVGGTQTNTTVSAATLRPYEGVLSAVKTDVSKYEDGEMSLVECLYKFEHDEDGYISLYKTKYPLEESAESEYREFQPLKKVKF